MATDYVCGYRVHYSQELGRGAFGTVYRGLNPTGEVVAVKKISTETREDKRKASVEAMKLHFLKDKDLHQNEHISRIDDVKYWHNAAWIMMEYCGLGDLNQFFKNHQKYVTNIDVKYKLMKQIINGIAFLHERNIVHRDIKPGNILLKLSPERHAVVKLGDFGLSKILDPDSQTSAMSSNVGTLNFKAPEFWETAPDADGKVRYHRNVDVYAAGLTFAALLQAKPARSLMPKPEGSMQPAENLMPLGLAALNRKVNMHPDINIVIHQPNDTQLVKIIKRIIMEMTHVLPNQRLPATVVEQKLQEPVTIPSGTLTLDYFKDCVSLVHGKLVIRELNLDTNNYSLRLFSFASKSMETIGPCRCDHYLGYGLLSACPENRASLVNHLMEGCAHRDCRVIRRYNTQSGESTVVYKDVEPEKICLGPAKTLLVFDRKGRSLLQLVFRDGKLQPIRVLRLNILWFHSMTYEASSGRVIVSDYHAKQIKVIALMSGDVVWQQSQAINTPNTVKLEPDDLCASSTGWVWVANHGGILFFNPLNPNLFHTPELADRPDPTSSCANAPMAPASPGQRLKVAC